MSVQTASHVLSGTPRVRLPETTRQRVIDAAIKVRYQPNRLAQAMKRGRTQVIALWIPLDRPTIAYHRYIKAIHDRVHAAGYELMIVGLESSLALSARGEVPNLWPVDGIIAVDSGKALQKVWGERKVAAIPSVILGYEELGNADSIAWELLETMQACTQELLDSGARRIVQLTPEWILADFPNERRRRGYSLALEAAGLEPVFIGVPGESSAKAELAMAEWLRHHPAPDGITAFSDALAVGAARALRERGVRIPEDCQIWGFGDLPEGTEFTIPISTIQLPTDRVIEQAWTWLSERIECPDIPSRECVLPMQVVRRASTRPPR